MAAGAQTASLRVTFALHLRFAWQVTIVAQVQNRVAVRHPRVAFTYITEPSFGRGPKPGY